jgi:formylglycine-generating enzyme required for sulfatase activity
MRKGHVGADDFRIKTGGVASGRPGAARIVVTALFDAGWGRSLFIRGEGPGLSWTEGRLMRNVAPERWEWTTEGMADSIRFKLLVDDREWCLGEDFTAEAGRDNVVEPDFGGPLVGGGRMVFDLWRVPGVGIRMMRVSPGSFLMGMPGGHAEAQHRVTLSDAYWIGVCPLTQGQWRILMGDNPSRFHYVGNEAPVESVSWIEAMEFCRRLTKRERASGRLPEGYVYSLPTEAQWEYACTAGRGDISGESAVLELSGWFSENSGGRTHPVGEKHANLWGMHDMLGNVCEWCWDWYGVLDASDATDPSGPHLRQKTWVPADDEDALPVTGNLVDHLGLGESLRLGKVCRGGSWQCCQGLCCSRARRDMDPSTRSASVGFRVALRRVIH